MNIQLLLSKRIKTCCEVQSVYKPKDILQYCKIMAGLIDFWPTGLYEFDYSSECEKRNCQHAESCMVWTVHARGD